MKKIWNWIKFIYLKLKNEHLEIYEGPKSDKAKEFVENMEASLNGLCFRQS